MVPPGRPRKGPRIHFQFADDAQAEAVRSAAVEDGIDQVDVIRAAIDRELAARARRIRRGSGKGE